MTITLTHGTLDNVDDLDAVIITSKTATVRGSEDVGLVKGDRITARGDVLRNGRIVANAR